MKKILNIAILTFLLVLTNVNVKADTISKDYTSEYQYSTREEVPHTHHYDDGKYVGDLTLTNTLDTTVTENKSYSKEVVSDTPFDITNMKNKIDSHASSNLTTFPPNIHITTDDGFEGDIYPMINTYKPHPKLTTNNNSYRFFLQGYQDIKEPIILHTDEYWCINAWSPMPLLWYDNAWHINYYTGVKDFTGSKLNGLPGIEGYYLGITTREKPAIPVYTGYLVLQEYSMVYTTASLSRAVEKYAGVYTGIITPKEIHAYITTDGTLKENRKVTLNINSTDDIDWSKTQWKVTAVSGGTDTDIKTLDSYNGTSTMNFIFKKKGTYKATATIYDKLGNSSTCEKTIEIEEDIAPVVDFYLSNDKTIRDSATKQATFTLTDNSLSNDGDTISKRIWLYAYDTNCNGSYKDDTWYVYDNNAWRAIGGYTNLSTLNIDNITDNNLKTVQLKTNSVGKYDFELIVREEFGQPTIPSLITNADKRINKTY